MEQATFSAILWPSPIVAMGITLGDLPALYPNLTALTLQHYWMFTLDIKSLNILIFPTS